MDKINVYGTGVEKSISDHQRCTESEIFDSDSTPASAEYTPTPFRHILKFWTPTPDQTPR